MVHVEGHGVASFHAHTVLFRCSQQELPVYILHRGGRTWFGAARWPARASLRRAAQASFETMKPLAHFVLSLITTSSLVDLEKVSLL